MPNVQLLRLSLFREGQRCTVADRDIRKAERVNAVDASHIEGALRRVAAALVVCIDTACFAEVMLPTFIFHRYRVRFSLPLTTRSRSNGAIVMTAPLRRQMEQLQRRISPPRPFAIAFRIIRAEGGLARFQSTFVANGNKNRLPRVCYRMIARRRRSYLNFGIGQVYSAPYIEGNTCLQQQRRNSWQF